MDAKSQSLLAPGNIGGRREYRYGLSLTSQFYFCSLPLRLDTYSTCAFRCTYCFAHARGGAHRDLGASVYSSERLARRFSRISEGRRGDVIDEMLAHGQPVHLGGMTDPFSAFEDRYGESAKILRILASYRHPTVISTKSDRLAQEPYLSLLKAGRFLVQVSLSSMDDRLLRRVDKGAPGPTRVMRMLAVLRSAGVPTSVRIQPLLPGLEEHANDVVHAAAEAGVRHIGVEHLKLAVERGWSGSVELAKALNIDLHSHFMSAGARRIGREWMLPAEKRLDEVLAMRALVRSRGMSFGAADTDFLLFSDGRCCCSGADSVSGFENHFRYNYLGAARAGLDSGHISLDALSNEWAPDGSIAEHVNSNSRLPAKDGKGIGVRAYIERNWNGSTNGSHMAGLYGVVESGEVDDRGFKIFRVSDDVRRIANS